jgi:hypothetical protein
MRALLPCLLLPPLLWPLPAHAMNWEGHDDWMTDMEPAVVYEEAAPHAVPRKAGGCAARPENDQDDADHNPYEQIPLARHACPDPRPAPDPDR